jgi:hypothetical protein
MAAPHRTVGSNADDKRYLSNLESFKILTTMSNAIAVITTVFGHNMGE